MSGFCQSLSMALKSSGVSLVRAISKLGHGSRKEAETWIQDGIVRVNGSVVRNSKRRVNLKTDRIEIGGQKMTKSTPRYFVFYKPKGVISTSKDERGRKTVLSFFAKEKEKLHCVGRLDQATSGLLLVTNDTQFSNYITDPRSEVPKTYLVTVKGKVTDENLLRLRRGIIDKGEHLKPQSVVIRKASNIETHLVFTLTEGKNREIRRLAEAIGSEVKSLKRVQLGELTVGDLKPGEYREITKPEVVKIFPNCRVSR